MGKEIRSQVKELIIFQLARGASFQDAARVSGVAYNTVRKIYDDEECQARIEKVRNDLRELQQDTKKAIITKADKILIKCLDIIEDYLNNGSRDSAEVFGRVPGKVSVALKFFGTDNFGKTDAINELVKSIRSKERVKNELSRAGEEN